jgi:transposase InsO family protein
MTLSLTYEAKYRATYKLELVHGDLCGPVTPVTPTGKRYFFLLVNDVSHFMRLMLLETKDEASATFKKFQARAETDAGRKVGMLRTDHGAEFTTRDFLDHCIKHRVQCHFTVPYTLEQNGVVEWHNQSIMGMARSMLKAMSMSG